MLNKKVIIADDSKTFLMYAEVLLKRLGFTSLTAHNGIEALKLLKLTKADAVILDVHMETMDGMAVLKYIREDKQTSHIPVIMVSIDSNAATIEKCNHLGCCDYMIKPIKVAALHETIQRCCYKKRGRWRKYIRAFYEEKVPVAFNGKEYWFFAEDLSEGGIYLRTEDPFLNGSVVSIALPLRNEGSINVKGVVVYSNRNSGNRAEREAGMAIEFRGLTKESSKILRSYVESLLFNDIVVDQDEAAIEA